MIQKFQIQPDTALLNPLVLTRLNEVDDGIIKCELQVLKNEPAVLAYDPDSGNADDHVMSEIGLELIGFALRDFFKYVTPIYKSGGIYYGEFFKDCNILIAENINKFDLSDVIQKAYEEFNSTSDNDLVTTLNNLLF